MRIMIASDIHLSLIHILKLTAEFYQHAFVARVLQWISDDMDLAPDKLAMVCECMFRRTVKGALESAQKVAENLEN